MVRTYMGRVRSSFNTLIFAVQLREKHGKTSVRVVRKYQLCTIQCVHMAIFQVARTS